MDEDPDLLSKNLIHQKAQITCLRRKIVMRKENSLQENNYDLLIMLQTSYKISKSKSSWQYAKVFAFSIVSIEFYNFSV